MNIFKYDTVFAVSILAFIYAVIVGLSSLIAGPAKSVYTLIVCGVGFVGFFSVWIFTLNFDSEDVFYHQKNQKFIEYLEISTLSGLAWAIAIFLVLALHHAVFFTLETAIPERVFVILIAVLVFGYLNSADEMLRSFSNNRAIETICTAIALLIVIAFINGAMRTIASADQIGTGALTLTAMILGLVTSYFINKIPSYEAKVID